MIKRLAKGVAAGLAATFVIQGLLEAGQKLMPEGTPPIKEDPGAFMVNKAKKLLPESISIPEKVEKAAAKSLHLGYGITAGALYGLLPHSRFTLGEGVLVGLCVWAAGYLGWLPATKLMPPITRHSAKQITLPLVQHALFGVAVSEGYKALEV